MTHSTLRKRQRRELPRRHMTAPSMGPKTETIQAILGYSKALKVIEAPPLGTVELILN